MSILSTILHILNKKNCLETTEIGDIFLYADNFQEQNRLQISGVMNNTTIINIFNSDNSNIV